MWAMALVESAISGVAVTVIDRAIKMGGYAGQQIKDAYTGTLAEQKRIAAVSKSCYLRHCNACE